MNALGLEFNRPDSLHESRKEIREDRYSDECLQTSRTSTLLASSKDVSSPMSPAYSPTSPAYSPISPLLSASAMKDNTVTSEFCSLSSTDSLHSEADYTICAITRNQSMDLVSNEIENLKEHISMPELELHSETVSGLLDERKSHLEGIELASAEYYEELADDSSSTAGTLS